MRLFNLSPDTKVAGMSMGGTVLAVRKNDHLFFPGCVSKNGTATCSLRVQNDRFSRRSPRDLLFSWLFPKRK